MQPAHQPVPDDEYRVVTLDSPEFRAFLKKIQSNNESKHKLSACLLCWGFITFYQKRTHQNHSHYIVTPAYFRDEKTFLSLAQKHSKYIEQPDGGVLVGVFAEQCKIIESSYTNAPNRCHAFAQSGSRNGGGFANQSVSEIRQVCQQQINQENQIKRLNTMITALYEECKIKERRIIEIEEAMIQMQQLVCGGDGNIKPLTMIGSYSTFQDNQFPTQISMNQQQQNLIGAFANKPHQVQNKINIAGCSSKQEKKALIKKQKQSNSQESQTSVCSKIDNQSAIFLSNENKTDTLDETKEKINNDINTKNCNKNSTQLYSILSRKTNEMSSGFGADYDDYDDYLRRNNYGYDDYDVDDDDNFFGSYDSYGHKCYGYRNPDFDYYESDCESGKHPNNNNNNQSESEEYDYQQHGNNQQWVDHSIEQENGWYGDLNDEQQNLANGQLDSNVGLGLENLIVIQDSSQQDQQQVELDEYEDYEDEDDQEMMIQMPYSTQQIQDNVVAATNDTDNNDDEEFYEEGAIQGTQQNIEQQSVREQQQITLSQLLQMQLMQQDYDYSENEENLDDYIDDVEYYYRPNAISREKLLSIINSYPSNIYKNQYNNIETVTCAVCIDDFKSGCIFKMLKCSHKYHSNCIDEWLKTKLQCPLCKKEVTKL
eukprot:403352587